MITYNTSNPTGPCAAASRLYDYLTPDEACLARALLRQALMIQYEIYRSTMNALEDKKIHDLHISIRH